MFGALTKEEMDIFEHPCFRFNGGYALFTHRDKIDKSYIIHRTLSIDDIKRTLNTLDSIGIDYQWNFKNEHAYMGYIMFIKLASDEDRILFELANVNI